MLVSQPLGPPIDAPRLVLAHGFTQNARCWGRFGDLCAQSFDTVAVDAPGHGQSGYDNADLPTAGNLIVGAGGWGHYVGYSMGGRMLLHAALSEHRGLLKSLILIGATAGIEDDKARAERRARDEQLANEISSKSGPAFITEWLAQPMFAHLTEEQSAATKRFENSPEGMAASLRNCGTGTQLPLWDQLASIAIPVLIIAGTRDDKFSAIGQRMMSAIGSNARFVSIEGGHAVHLENPEVTAEVVKSWGHQLG